MKKNILLAIILFLVFTANAQFTYNTNDYKLPLSTVINMSDNDEDFDPKLILLKSSSPKPVTAFNLNKQQLDEKHYETILNYNGKSKNVLNKTGVALPTQLKGFKANITQGTPNDNDVAVSNAGIICSVVNTNMNIVNDTGRVLSARTLSSIAKGITNLNRTYDPRVIYDPEADRFILVFMQGSTSKDTRIIVGFSQTNDPSLNWNFYTIPGNILGDSSWSDYPIISITKNELFLTINRLKDNTYWKNGFIESYIWQMDKDNGYKGDTLNQKVYFDIKYNNKPIWSICPAKGGSKSYGPNMFLFSVRPDQLWNDTVFVHEITNTIKSGKAELKTKLVVADNHYGLQPNAFQPNGKKLQTNDARVLSAMYENGIFYLVGNSVDARYNAAGFYLITIDNYWGPNALKAKLQIISSDTMDYGYPSIAYCGGGIGDNSAMITCSHVSPRTFPGTSLVYVDKYLNPSTPAIMKAGESNILLIGDSVERWGDYTGIQRKYNELGKVFFNGSYALNNDNRTWIGISKNADTKLNFQDTKNNVKQEISIYPLPAKDYITVDFEIEARKVLTFSIIDMQGKEIPLHTEYAKAGLNRFTFNALNLNNGFYQLIIKEGETLLQSKKIMVTH
jgi:hypothetical protein